MQLFYHNIDRSYTIKFRLIVIFFQQGLLFYESLLKPTYIIIATICQ